jgi:hypothetical protein
MHYTINYAHLSGEAKQAKAVSDVKEFLGAERFDKIVQTFKDAPGTPQEYFVNACGLLCGISGYPAEAFYRYIYGKQEPVAPPEN